MQRSALEAVTSLRVRNWAFGLSREKRTDSMYFEKNPVEDLPTLSFESVYVCSIRDDKCVMCIFLELNR